MFDCAIVGEADLRPLIDEGDERLVIFDASYQLSGEMSCREKYEAAHIPGAQFFDITEIVDKDSDLPNMLPSAAAFEAFARTHGVHQNSIIVIYGQEGVVMGPARAWWMFRVFGHDDVYVLDGGLCSWSGDIVAECASPQVGDFKAEFHSALVVNKTQVEKAISDEEICILDARAPERFWGKLPEPRAGLRAGHIEGSVNLPCSLLLHPETRQVKPKNEIKSILRDFSIDLKVQIITSCGSGVTACFLALVLYDLGCRDTAVYDGSWAEWGLCGA